MTVEEGEIRGIAGHRDCGLSYQFGRSTLMKWGAAFEDRVAAGTVPNVTESWPRILHPNPTDLTSISAGVEYRAIH